MKFYIKITIKEIPVQWVALSHSKVIIKFCHYTSILKVSNLQFLEIQTVYLYFTDFIQRVLKKLTK